MGTIPEELVPLMKRLLNENFIYIAPKIAEPLVKLGLIEANAEMTNDIGQVAVRITDAGRTALVDLEAAEAATDDTAPAAPWSGGPAVSETTLRDESATLAAAASDMATAATDAAEDAAGDPDLEAANPSDLDVTVDEQLPPHTGAIAIDADIVVPDKKMTRTARRDPKYPFAKLAKGESFHVPTVEGLPSPNKKLSSAVSGYLKTLRDASEKGDIIPEFTVRSVGEKDPRGIGARVFRLS